MEPKVLDIFLIKSIFDWALSWPYKEPFLSKVLIEDKNKERKISLKKNWQDYKSTVKKLKLKKLLSLKLSSLKTK